MSCQPSAALDICPTADDIQPQLLALLPPGRAWGTHDGGPWPDTVLYRFWYAVANMWAWVNASICALAQEFFCATQSATHDLWMEEYGLPDGCDPYPDLCAKVAAVGGTRCDYFTAVAARAGWDITCRDVNTGCGSKAGPAALAGQAISGAGIAPNLLFITVSLGTSPAYTGSAPIDTPTAAAPVATASPPHGFVGLAPPLAGRSMAGALLSCFQGSTATELAALPFAGCFQAGQALGCQGGAAPEWPLAGAALAGRELGCLPDLTGLVCILERIVGAHLQIIYEALP